MKHVYILSSINRPEQLYVGTTSDLQVRLAAHNRGRSPHTSKFRPWELVYQEEYQDSKEALRREKQIKRWSGKKKLALISGNVVELQRLSRSKNTLRALRQAQGSIRLGTQWPAMSEARRAESNGGGGNRTRVRETLTSAFYTLIGKFNLTWLSPCRRIHPGQSQSFRAEQRDIHSTLSRKI